MRKAAYCSTLALILASGASWAVTPKTAPDNSWISVTGTVISTAPNAFELDYGPGTVTVEMDDWDWYPEGRKLIEGEKVSVSGLIDDDTFETRSIEASTVYSKTLNTFYHASAADEESSFYPYGTVYAYPADVSDMISVTGEVYEIQDRHMKLETGSKHLVVDTSQMDYNPLDDEGYQQIDLEDHVRVIATGDGDMFHDHEIVAVSIDKLSGDDSF